MCEPLKSELLKMQASQLPTLPWLEVLNPASRLGSVQAVLFDFDGTLSVIRHGWEQVMISVMLESICENQPPAPEIKAEVTQYVDKSTGNLTIKQMQWLEETVRRYGVAKNLKRATEYKRIYLNRLLQPVYERLSQMDGSLETRQSWMVAGAQEFLLLLQQRGIKLFLASGTDQEYVAREAEALGIAHFFQGQIYGAQGDSEIDSKESVIQHILAAHGLFGEKLLVVGDGPAEIQYARQVGAITLGVACLEADRLSLDERKRQRLIRAGADFIISNYLHSSELIKILCSS